jgi:hypothetical protein
MSAIVRVIAFCALASVIAAALPASSAVERFVMVKNSTGDSIDVGFIQPSVSQTTTVKYGNIGSHKELLFNLEDRGTTILVKSSGCFDTSRKDLPNDRRLTVNVSTRCALAVTTP